MERMTRLIRSCGFLLTGVLSLCLAWTGQQVLGQTGPDTASQGPQPKAMLVDGQPALSLDNGDGNGLLIVYTKWQDEPALRFSVLVEEHFIRRDCSGYIWISRSRVAWTPLGPTAQECSKAKRGEPGSFDALRTDFSWRISNLGMMTDLFLLTRGLSLNEGIYPTYRPDLSRVQWNLEEAQAASHVAKRWFQAALNNFTSTEQQFLLVTTGNSLVLSPEQKASVDSSVKSGDAAKLTGDYLNALNDYTSAFATLPASASGQMPDSLRQRIFEVAEKLNPRPAIPDEAQRYFFGSQAALQEWKDKGDPTKLDDAIEQLNEALRIAPWWPEAYFNRGLVLEDRERYAEAVESFKLYLLAAPNASDATQVKQKIYMLEYKAKEADGQK